MDNRYSRFINTIAAALPKENVYSDELRRFAWGTDASCYRLIPEAVLKVDDEEQVSTILKAASREGLPVTFRAAGTSLSGQSVSDSILVVAGKGWEKYKVEEESVTLQPGLTGGKVNRILSGFGRKFGPDPASVASAMIGGIVANNASGMSCGIHANSDRMLTGIRIVLADGTILDTRVKASREAFASSHKDLLDNICNIRDEVLADEELTALIRKKYSIKNVTGLNLLPLVSYSDPFEILAHLMVGSEGTLAFISEVTMKTLPLERFSASAMIYYKDIVDAAKAAVALNGMAVSAAEMLDYRSLMSVKDPHGEAGNAALLVKVEAGTEDDLKQKIEKACSVLGTCETLSEIRFSSDVKECAAYWAIRSGIFPTVGGLRKEGTTCLIEDIAFPIDVLPQATARLSALLDEHGYDDSCIYGHALAGNFHFIINQSFENEVETARYERLIRSVADMVVTEFSGSLKAEHGTGRNMAPFVAFEWGEKAYGIMKKIKDAFDPDSILNPGVIFNDDPRCFLKDFKHLPVIRSGSDAPHETVEAFKQLNKCIECGFCEVNCVSCGLTLSSRTRIASIRQITTLEASDREEDRMLARRMRNLYRYYGEQTCAGDGLCSTSCPMGINVADLTHEIRRVQTPPTSATYKLWDITAEHFSGSKKIIRSVLCLAETGRFILGDKVMSGICNGLHKAGVPLWTPSMPKPFRYQGNSQPENDVSKNKARQEDILRVVYFPSCFNQMMGPSSKTQRPLVEEMLGLLSKAGYEVIFPKDMDMLCCGTIWESKGMPDVADTKTAEQEKALWEATDCGRWPVLCDQSPCLHRMRSKIKTMKLYEPAEFIWTFLKDKLEFHQTDTPIAVHQTCSTRIMGLGDTIIKLAELCSSRVTVPENVGCCGFAGDKGMTNPELNAHALRTLKSGLIKDGVTAGYSNSRTCEIGLQHNSGVPYSSIVYLVNSCTRAKASGREQKPEP